MDIVLLICRAARAQAPNCKALKALLDHQRLKDVEKDFGTHTCILFIIFFSFSEKHCEGLPYLVRLELHSRFAIEALPHLIPTTSRKGAKNSFYHLFDSREVTNIDFEVYKF